MQEQQERNKIGEGTTRQAAYQADKPKNRSAKDPTIRNNLITHDLQNQQADTAKKIKTHVLTQCSQDPIPRILLMLMTFLLKKLLEAWMEGVRRKP